MNDPASPNALSANLPGPAANQALLEGQLLAPLDYRVTSTGRPVLFFELEHLSCHEEPDSALRLEARMPVMALGELADRCRTLMPGCTLRVTGRLNQKRWVRDGKVRWGRLELVAMEIRMLCAPESA
ncbi:MAG: single-stranded DNA-binding protein [Magnetococcales bacterium]|nr:single-stranded DNA-binding protein [Magnetococcales bacterium]